MGILADVPQFDNGSCEIRIKTDSNQTGYDKVVVGSSTGADSALRFMLKMEGFVESLATGHLDARQGSGYVIADSKRYMARSIFRTIVLRHLKHTSIGWYHDRWNEQQFRLVRLNLRCRGGRAYSQSSVNPSNRQLGSETQTRPITYQIGRDNRMEIRPTYNSGEAIKR